MRSSTLIRRHATPWGSLIGFRAFPAVVSTWGREAYPPFLVGQQRLLCRDSTPNASLKPKRSTFNSPGVLLPASCTLQGAHKRQGASPAAFGSTWSVMGGRAANSTSAAASAAGRGETSETANQHINSGQETRCTVGSSDQDSAGSADVVESTRFSARTDILRDAAPISTVSCEIEDRIGALCELLVRHSVHSVHEKASRRLVAPQQCRIRSFALETRCRSHTVICRCSCGRCERSLTEITRTRLMAASFVCGSMQTRVPSFRRSLAGPNSLLSTKHFSQAHSATWLPPFPSSFSEAFARPRPQQRQERHYCFTVQLPGGRDAGLGFAIACRGTGPHLCLPSVVALQSADFTGFLDPDRAGPYARCQWRTLQSTFRRKPCSATDGLVCSVRARVLLQALFAAYGLNITNISSTPNPLDMRKM